MADPHRNPWKRGGHSQAQPGRKKPFAQNTGGKNFQASSQSLAEKKFLEAQARLQASVQKHLKQEYDSSSEEEELESDNILGSVLKQYSQIGGKTEDLGRTQRFLEDAFQSGAASCLICIASVKRNDAIWSCLECFCFFHLSCIQRWAKDSIMHQKQALEDLPRHGQPKTFSWACPKCRHDYEESSTPKRYYCFCGRMEDPPFHPWLVPHSCGETCGKDLQPLCGHACLLLCHPGPCPPCPKVVKTTCYCGKQDPRSQRCSNKTWSCGEPCRQLLGCGRHRCNDVCHTGDCSPCPRTSVQNCECGREQMLRPCAQPTWQCTNVCGKPLNCGHHTCKQVCHRGSCGACPLTGARSCPCGKTSYILPCTEEIPTCGDTCGRTLECGLHVCPRSCHRDKCGSCLETIQKQCRCGLHTKELPCQKEFLCETKCKRTKDCLHHPCNRKCCDGNCPPCEKPCGRMLRCGNHKCESVCHRGPCYPCPLTVEVKCRCGLTVLVVPCGRKKQTRPPRCYKPCRIEPNCHHPSRELHRCHLGDCPPCKQVCGKMHETCRHSCPAPCHSAVWVKVQEDRKPAGPWEKIQPQIELRDLPCPECKVPVPVQCLGGHETSEWPCYLAKPSSCQRTCGRQLSCGNHLCSLPCHTIEDAPDDLSAGSNCEICEFGCTKKRPEGCTHVCLKPCHPGDCPPCNQMIRVRCNCALNQLYVRCSEWTSTKEKSQLQNCGNQCPKLYPCGHRCRSDCHIGECPEPEACRKKVKVTCSCRRLRKEFPCNVVRSGEAKVECDEVCRKKKEENLKAKEAEDLARRLEEERKNQEELEKFNKKFQSSRGGKKHRRKQFQEEETTSLASKYWFPVVCVSGLVLAFYAIVLWK